MDINKFRPHGPWVLIRIDPAVKQEGLLYLPDGNLMERLGYASGIVVSKGEGFLNKGKKATTKYSPLELEPGDRVVFRGFRQELIRPAGMMDREYCLIHASEILGILEDGGQLNPALPHGN